MTGSALRADSPDQDSRTCFEQDNRFADFYKATFQHTLSRAFISSRNRSVAYDATQDAYVEMLQKWPDRYTRSHDDNRRYTIGIAVKKVADWYRQQERWSNLEDWAENGSEDLGFTTVVDSLSLIPKIRSIIDRQPPQRKAVAILFFLEDYKYNEIADLLGISKSTLRTHVERIRRELRPYCEETGR